MAKKKEEPKPSHYIEAFLNFYDQAKTEYEWAYRAVNDENKALQDHLHLLEDADEKEISKAARALRKSRRERRKNKLTVQKYEPIITFFEDQNNRRLLNLLRQLLGEQRKKESYVYGEKTYRLRKLKGE